MFTQSVLNPFILIIIIFPDLRSAGVFSKKALTDSSEISHSGRPISGVVHVCFRLLILLTDQAQLSKTWKTVLIHISESYSPIEKLFGLYDAGW